MQKTAPKYIRIKEDLIAGVASRRFRDRLPSENELARRYRVSRMTARKALDELVRDGIARRIPGKGTFLKKKDFAILNKDDSYFNFLKSKVKSAKVITIGINNSADFRAADIDPTKKSFCVIIKNKKYKFKTCRTCELGNYVNINYLRRFKYYLNDL